MAADLDAVPRCACSHSRIKSKHQGSAQGGILLAAATATASFTIDWLNGRATATPIFSSSFLFQTSSAALQQWLAGLWFTLDHHLVGYLIGQATTKKNVHLTNQKE